MKIRSILIRNFKRFGELTLDLDPQFTLIVGENGSGKTTILDALAIASAVWLVEVPDSKLANSRRSILGKEVRLVPRAAGDRVQFVQRKPVVIEAAGEICGRAVTWRRQVREGGYRTTNVDARGALAIVRDHYARVRDGDAPLSPVVPTTARDGHGWPLGNAFRGCARTAAASRQVAGMRSTTALTRGFAS